MGLLAKTSKTKNKKEQTATRKKTKKEKKEKKSKGSSTKTNKKKKKEKKSKQMSCSSSSSSSTSQSKKSSRVEVVNAQEGQVFHMAGVMKAARRNPKDYLTQVLKFERPDLFGNEVTLDPEECIALDKYLRDKGEFMINEHVVVNEKLKITISSKFAEGRIGCIYAVKVPKEIKVDKGILAMKTSIRQSQVSTDRLLREIKMLQAVRERMKKLTVKRIIEIGLDGTVLGIPYYLMQPMNTSLERTLNDKEHLKFCHGCVYFLATEILMAIRDLHAMKIVHRDIKPANFVFMSPRWILIDLGDARYVDDSPDYITPPDYQTLPYLSLNGHKSVCSKQNAHFVEDVESFFYILINMIQTLPWKSQLEEQDVLRAKIDFWKNVSFLLLDFPTTIQSMSEVVMKELYPYNKIYNLLKEGYEKTKVPNHFCWETKAGAAATPLKKGSK